jgi:adenylyl-sulfate kinase
MSAEIQPNPNVFAQPSRVSPRQRAAVLRQSGGVVWFTGLPGSGKSTLAQALEVELIRTGHGAFILDGDNMRRGLCADLSFSAEDRHENIRRVAQVAALFADSAQICIAAFVSPYIADRAAARDIVGPDRFLEVHVSTPLSVCEQRDPKGLYQKARQGKVSEFTGVSSPYEPPPHPDVTINTTEEKLPAVIQKLMQTIKDRGFIH